MSGRRCGVCGRLDNARVVVKRKLFLGVVECICGTCETIILRGQKAAAREAGHHGWVAVELHGVPDGEGEDDDAKS